MKRKSLLIMLLVALFVPLAMNAQTQRLRKNVTRAPRTQLQFEVAGQLQAIEDFQPGKVYHRATTNTRDNVLYSNGFEDGEYQTISIYDNDGDGYNWGIFGDGGVDDSYCAYSQSYVNNVGALTPDNWIIMPAVTLPAGNAQYFASIYAQSVGGYGETMGIYVAPENDDYIHQVGSDFNLSTGEYEFCEVDLSAYAGQTIEIYIRHYNCTDGWYLLVDNFSIYSRVAEEEITIGSGTSNSTNYPTRTNQYYSFTQQIYTATEIDHTDGGNITSVSFYSTGNSTRSFDVYMVNTTMTQFSSTSANLTPTPTASDRVFSGSVSFTANAWTKITFDTPFEYTGGNVVLIVDDNTGSSSGNSARNFRVFSTGNNNYQARYIYGTTNYGISQSSFTQRSSSKNQVKFTIQAAPTPVESITASDLSMMAGISAQIDYTVLPADATNPAVTFTSANTSVATVSASGLVTGVAAGTTTITLTSVSNPEVSTTINVIVEEFVGLIFDFETNPNEEGWTFVDSDGDGFNWVWEDCSETPHMTPMEGEGCLYSLSYDNDNNAALTPDNWAITPAIHILSSPSVVYLYAEGQDASYAAEHFQVYIGTSPDPASMTAISSEFVATGSYVQYSTNIPDTYAGQIVYLAIRHFNVTDMFALDVDYLIITNAELAPEGTLVESITADDVTVAVGQTASITNLEVLPTDATNPAVTYTSNDETIATVNDNGVVTGVAVGTTTITIAATDGSGVTATINVTVNGIDVTGITVENVTVVNGETATINYTVAPSDATDQSVTFTSANTNIATVDADGVVTGVGVGETTITIASVSNPEVTAEITVTVTSNPNAVQFTVNAPANAHPGEVITVEGVLAAPTSGTWGGFTDLAMGIYYDNTAFEYVANSMAYGPVAQQAQQLNSFMTPSTTTDAVLLGINCFNYGSFVTAEGVVFSAQFTVLDGAEGEYTFTAQPNNAGNFDHEGVLIPYEATPSTVEVAELVTFTKDITAYTETGGFYFIASPVSTTPTEVTNMLSNTYDLYRFNQSAPADDQGITKEWENYKKHQSDFYITPGQGYLYANVNDVTLEFSGTLYNGNGTFDLAYDNNVADAVKGMNLVGNPYPETATVSVSSFYTMNHDDDLVANTVNTVAAMEGIMVVATATGQSVTFTRGNGSKANDQLVLNISQGRGIIDRAIVRFDNDSQLPKFQLFETSTKLYIPQGTQDFAVVNAEAQGEMPVNFKAKNNGTYTVSVNAENVEFNYLHLIDNMTGADIDLLETPSYSFEANTYDYESRFKLVFAKGDNSNSNEFAFISDGNIIVNGEGLLQVIDMTGRVITTSQVNGMSSIKLNAAAGVYVLKLNDKTQKIVLK